MPKRPRIEIKPDEIGSFRVFLYSGNGTELFRSPTVRKRGNGERTLERIREALPVAEVIPGPRQAERDKP